MKKETHTRVVIENNNNHHHHYHHHALISINESSLSRLPCSPTRFLFHSQHKDPIFVQKLTNVYITFNRLCLMNFHRILRDNCLPRNKKKSTQNDYDDTWLSLANTRLRWNTCDRLLNTNHYCVSYAKNYKDIINFQIRSNFTIIDQHWILRCTFGVPSVSRNSFMKFCSLRTTLPSFRDESTGNNDKQQSNVQHLNLLEQTSIAQFPIGNYS